MNNQEGKRGKKKDHRNSLRGRRADVVMHLPRCSKDDKRDLGIT